MMKERRYEGDDHVTQVKDSHEMMKRSYLDSLSSPRFSSSSSLPLYSYSVSSARIKSRQTLHVQTLRRADLQYTDVISLLTFLSPLLARTVDMVFELDPDLPLGGLVPDERVLEKLLRGRSAGIRLHQTALYKVNEFFGPGRKRGR